nr:matrix metalloproteinase-19-like [Lytechinus pictus]
MKRFIVLFVFGFCFGSLTRVLLFPTRIIGNESRGGSSASHRHFSPIVYLARYGYLVPGAQHSPALLKDAITSFQEYANLKRTGILDEATRDKLQADRCGVADIGVAGQVGYHQQGTNPRSRMKRNANCKKWRTLGVTCYSKPVSKWSNNDLTYYFKNFTPIFPNQRPGRLFKRAFKLWADVTPLTFTETTSVSADIIIEFARGIHGFLHFFDGPGGILADAAPPEIGYVHFDEDETFVVDDDGDERPGHIVNLFYVAAHEFGHSLGLEHSNVTSALMYAYYNKDDRLPTNINEFQLHQDDIDAIQRLYGGPTNVTGTDRGTRGGVIPADCDIPWDAATTYPRMDAFYAFKGHLVWAMDRSGIHEGYPKNISQVFRGAPSRVQAVVHQTEKTYMFKGKKIWRFDGNRRLEKGFPRPSPVGFPTAPDAALQANRKIYIFKGASFQEFFQHNLTVGAPSDISQHWGGIPSNIDAALQWFNGKTYFFKDNEYWRFNYNKMKAANGYPKPWSEYWMGCGQPDVRPRSPL